ATTSHCGFPWQQMIIDLMGKVEPCCYFSGYGNSGLGLGDANRQSLEEIWNGPGYQDLRRIIASGTPPDDHPCHPDNCMARRSGGIYPSFHVGSINITKNGFGYVIPLPEDLIEIIASTAAPCLVYEDGKPLPLPDAAHVDVFGTGLGRYSVWGNWLYLSSSDNTDPCENGRSYRLHCGDHVQPVPLPYERNCLSGGNISTALAEYQNQSIALQAKPTSIQLSSTADCNIDCPHCSQNAVRHVGVQLRPGVIDEVLEMVPYLQEFMWLGGEPYLISRFRRFIDDFDPADNPNLCFGFTSNATMLNAAETAKLLKFPRLNIAISVDSFTPETFERVRAGAKFDRVMANLDRLLAHYDRARRTITVGMTIFKGTIREIAANVRTAIERDIPLNLSPCLGYPAHERLDVFRDVEAETEGWAEALDEALALVRAARAEGRKSILRNDMESSLLELRNQLLRAKARYGHSVSLTVHIDDPLDVLPRMRNPAFLVQIKQVISYVRLDGPGTYTLNLPAADLVSDGHISWYLTDDIYHEGLFVADGFEAGQIFQSISLTLPAFTPTQPAKNIVQMKKSRAMEGTTFSSLDEVGTANKTLHSEQYGGLLPNEPPGVAALRRGAGLVRYDDPLALSTLRQRVTALKASTPQPATRSVVLVISNLGPGGAERQISYLAMGMADAGWSVTVLALTLEEHGTHFAKHLIERGIPIHALDEAPRQFAASDWRRLVRVLPSLHRAPKEIQSDVTKATALLGRWQPDLVICYLDWMNLIGGLAAVLSGVPRVLMSGRNLDPTHLPYLLQPWFHDLYQQLLTSPSVTLKANSAAGARSYEHWLGLPPHVVPVVHNGLSEDAMPPSPDRQVQAVRAELTGDDGGPLLLGVFRLSPEKRPELFFDLAERLRAEFPGLRAAIAGLGNSFDECQELLRSTGRDSFIRLLGRRSDMPALYQAADLMLHVSSAEGVPNAVMEAQWLGCPVVGTLGGGTAEILTKAQQPYFHDLDDLDAVWKSCVRLLRDTDLRRRVGDDARTEARRLFSISRLVSETIALADQPSPFNLPRQRRRMPRLGDLTGTLSLALRLLRPRQRLRRLVRQTHRTVISDIGHSGGFAWHTPVPVYLESDEGGTSVLRLFEDGQPLSPAHAVHDAIRECGGGRYSHWGRYLYFSTSDNSDPRTNG
ncbi:MAG: glycosyltransferase, partial [Magnetospirillum sp.]|nr:glycosyltransferase [Magnetospirillum sp.]